MGLLMVALHIYGRLIKGERPRRPTPAPYV